MINLMTKVIILLMIMMVRILMIGIGVIVRDRCHNNGQVDYAFDNNIHGDDGLDHACN